MKSLGEVLQETWRHTLNGCAKSIPALPKEYSAYAIRETSGAYAVAVPYAGDVLVNEEFNAVGLKTESRVLGGKEIRLLILSCEKGKLLPVFSALSGEFIYPGVNGTCRNRLLNNPVEWWKGWKELLGNKNVNTRVYDVLGELHVLLYLKTHGQCSNVSWRGPSASSYDIHTESGLYEVKSSLSRSERRIVVHNQFQLDAGEIPLSIVFCGFEPSDAGQSIDDLVRAVVDGNVVPEDVLESQLSILGFEKGKSSRKQKYLLHVMEQYRVDSTFPKFDNLPMGVLDLEFTLELSAFHGERLV